MPLQNQKLQSNSVYIEVKIPPGVSTNNLKFSKVEFYLDSDPSRSKPSKTESQAPYDFQGGNAWDTSTVDIDFFLFFLV